MVTVSYSSDQLDDITPWMYSTETPEWTEGQVHVRSEMAEDKYANWMITIMGVKPGEMEAFIAVDDFAFHPTDLCETIPHSAGTGDVTTTTAGTPCSSDQFTCDDGTCIPGYKTCDFVFDCDDSSDEQECPTFYTFEDCSIPEDCYWDVVDGTGIEWVIGTGSEVAKANQTNGPFGDTNGNAYNHFLYIRPMPDSSKGFTQIASPIYGNSASECYFTFFVYMADGEPPNYPKLTPLISHSELGSLSKLDEINLSFIQSGVWTKVEIGIGRHRDQFKILFSLVNENEDPKIFKSGVAVDSVNFFGCAPPPPQEQCQLSSQFHCEVTKGCIPNLKLCDLQDDCGDNSDEVQECEKYWRVDFEDPENPFGYFTPGDKGLFSTSGDFMWGNYNGSSGYRGTGPPFDHTRFDFYGHYLMVPSELGLPGDASWLWSPMISATGSDRNCIMRFFSHMHGHGLGNLTIYIRDKEDTLTPALQINGFDRMDINKWKRQEVELISEVDFFVIIEATIGTAGDSDIAIDDVTFTPECL